MKQIFSFITAGIVMIAAIPAPVQADISGIVQNSGGTPVSGVLVRATSGPDTSVATRTTSAADGSFTIVLPVVGVEKAAVSTRSFQLSMVNGAVRIRSSEPGTISLGMYDSQGRQISLRKNLRIAKGYNEVAVKMLAADGFYFLRAKGKEFSGTLKVLSFERNVIASDFQAIGAREIPLGKTQAAGDIELAAMPNSGYFSACASAPNPSTGVVITLGDIPSGTVTYVGNLFGSNHTGATNDGAPAANLAVYFMVFSGTSPITGTTSATAEFTDIMNNYVPDGEYGPDVARAIQNQFKYRMQLSLSNNDLFSMTAYTCRNIVILTGTLTQANGQKVITVTSNSSGSFTFPAKCYTKWAGMPASPVPPLDIAVGSMTLKCIHVAPQRILLGEPFWMFPSWQEEPPHMLNWTNGYYFAEVPITNELLLAATGIVQTGNANSLADVSVATVDSFIKAVRADNPSLGTKIRKTYTAELCIAYRAGASTAPFFEKYDPACLTAFHGDAKGATPNPWGIYAWWVDDAWERTGDINYTQHTDVTDLKSPPAPGQCFFGGFGGWGPNYPICQNEYLTTCNAGPQSSHNHVYQRIVVDE